MSLTPEKQRTLEPAVRRGSGDPAHSLCNGGRALFNLRSQLFILKTTARAPRPLSSSRYRAGDEVERVGHP